MAAAGSLRLLRQPCRPGSAQRCEERLVCFSGSWAGSVPRRKHHFYQVKGGQVSAKWVEGGRWESRAGQRSQAGATGRTAGPQNPAWKGPAARGVFLLAVPPHGPPSPVCGGAHPHPSAAGLPHLSAGPPSPVCGGAARDQHFPGGPSGPQSSFELAGVPVDQGTLAGEVVLAWHSKAERPFQPLLPILHPQPEPYVW